MPLEVGTFSLWASVSEFYKKAAENPIADVDAGRLLLSGGINHNVAGLNIFHKSQYCWFKHFLINHYVAGLKFFDKPQCCWFQHFSINNNVTGLYHF